MTYQKERPARAKDLRATGQIITRNKSNGTISFEWYDGAGEFHVHVLDVQESSRYLTESVSVDGGRSEDPKEEE
jgi:hypothetical protein